jgi:hypothetical protein
VPVVVMAPRLILDAEVPVVLSNVKVAGEIELAKISAVD